MDDYPGMVLHLGIIYDISKNECQLDLEWIALGLDLYGENLLEYYLDEFYNIEALLTYTEEYYALTIADIPMRFLFDSACFPSPIKDEGL